MHKVLLVIAALVFVAACTVDENTALREPVPATVVVTTGFGRDVIVEDTVGVPEGTSALETLRRVADVETKYGGGFIDSINGIASRYPAEEDWFVHVNGMATNKGAGECSLYGGDILQMDYHEWSFRTFVPAMIGVIPGQLLHGFEGVLFPTAVVYQQGLADCAETLADHLEHLGVEVCFVGESTELVQPDRGTSNLVILGTLDSDMVSEMNDKWARLGFFLQLSDGGITAYDANGEAAAEYGAGTGVIQATQNPWNPNGTGVCETVAVMVSGTNEAGVRSAIAALVEQPEALRYACAAVVLGEEVIRIP